MLHKDFKETNEIWGWVEDDEGNLKFDQVTIDNAVAGDTDSIMLKLPENVEFDIDSAVEVSDEIASITNDSFPEWVIRAFNAPEERKHTIQTDREIVSDASLFLSKKRYIMRKVDDEGKRTNELKIMGVEIKKSDTPDAVKEMLLDLVKLILDDGSREDAFEFIAQAKKDYQKRPYAEIARPMSVNGMKKYQERYETYGNKSGFPYNVRAAMYYNELCSVSDKQIVAGDKVGILYIRGAKSKYIAFPLDVNQYPSFMDDILVDYETQWDKAYKKIISYMSTLGWDLQSRKDETKKQLFGLDMTKRKKRK